MPFINLSLVSFLVANIADYDAVVPFWEGRYQPLFAVYRSAIAPLLAEQMERGELRPITLIEKVRTLKALRDVAVEMGEQDVADACDTKRFKVVEHIAAAEVDEDRLVVAAEDVDIDRVGEPDDVCLDLHRGCSLSSGSNQVRPYWRQNSCQAGGSPGISVTAWIRLPASSKTTSVGMSSSR